MLRIKLRYLILFTIITNLSVNEAVSATRLHFRNLGTEQGLSNGAVDAILQDSKGFMWFGTKRGLNRWDGRSFSVFSYQPFDSTSIPSSRISALVETADNMLWVGTYDSGLARFNPQMESFHNYHSDAGSIPDENITALFVDSRDILWVGTDEGLNKFNVFAKGITGATKDIHFYPNPFEIWGYDRNQGTENRQGQTDNTK